MAKQCAEQGCNNPVFGGGYCKYHQWKRTDIKKTINKRTKKRTSQEAVYANLRPQNTKCWFCNRTIKKTPDRHHIEGRIEDDLTDISKLVTVHHKCHMEYHNKSAKDIWWFRDFLKRIKNTKYYYRELNKLTKN